MTAPITHPTELVAPATRPSTRALLLAAAFAGPFFYASAAVQMLVRPGFDLRVHPISQLATGDLGWIQITTFVLVGLALIGLAVAHRRTVHTGAGYRAMPVLFIVAGLGFIAAGMFPQDPAYGFPAGTPEGPAPSMSWHAVMHAAAAVVAFSAIAVATIIATVSAFRARRVWSAVGHGIVALALLLPVVPEHASIQVAATGLFGFTWITVRAAQLARSSHSLP